MAPAGQIIGEVGKSLRQRFPELLGKLNLGTSAETEMVQRAMSQAELEETMKTGLIRGGRGGLHYVSDAVNSDMKRARIRLALPQTPEVRVTLEVPKGRFGKSAEVSASNGMPGGGTERVASGNVPAKVVRIDR